MRETRKNRGKKEPGEAEDREEGEEAAAIHMPPSPPAFFFRSSSRLIASAITAVQFAGGNNGFLRGSFQLAALLADVGKVAITVMARIHH